MSKGTIATFQPVSKRKLAAAAVENQPGQSITQQRLLSNILDILNQFRLREVRSGNPRFPQLKTLCDLYRAVLVSRFAKTNRAAVHYRKERRNAVESPKRRQRK